MMIRYKGQLYKRVDSVADSIIYKGEKFVRVDVENIKSKHDIKITHFYPGESQDSFGAGTREFRIDFEGTFDGIRFNGRIAATSGGKVKGNYIYDFRFNGLHPDGLSLDKIKALILKELRKH